MLRSSLEAPFESATEVPAVPDPTRIESSPSLPDDGSIIVLMVDLEIHYAPMVGGVPQTPVPIPALDTDDLDYEPVARADGCELLFVSNRMETQDLPGAHAVKPVARAIPAP
ncbi:MAG: hypothetical protein OHK0013_09580 [Sandaracinaceae bacterium]